MWISMSAVFTLPKTEGVNSMFYEDSNAGQCSSVLKAPLAGICSCGTCFLNFAKTFGRKPPRHKGSLLLRP